MTAKTLVPMLLLILAFGGVSVISIIESRRSQQSFEEHEVGVQPLSASMVELQEDIAVLLLRFSDLEDQLAAVQHQLQTLDFRLGRHEHQGTENSDPTADVDSDMRFSDFVSEPFLLFSELSEEDAALLGNHKTELLYELTDGYTSLSLHNDGDPVSLSVENIEEAKRYLRLSALQFQHWIDTVEGKIAGGEYESFVEWVGAKNYYEVTSGEIRAEGLKPYLYVKKTETEFLVIDLSDHYTSAVYQMITDCQFDIVKKSQLDSFHATHHPRTQVR